MRDWRNLASAFCVLIAFFSAVLFFDIALPRAGYIYAGDCSGSFNCEESWYEYLAGLTSVVSAAAAILLSLWAYIRPRK
jgi:hypothetical protein